LETAVAVARRNGDIPVDFAITFILHGNRSSERKRNERYRDDETTPNGTVLRHCAATGRCDRPVFDGKPTWRHFSSRSAAPGLCLLLRSTRVASASTCGM